ncbi:MAG: hypothetical protein H0U70_05325 [Tatlockia sp.]|nr:hypothetical protein [Tatlockia sp.]
MYQRREIQEDNTKWFNWYEKAIWAMILESGMDFDCNGVLSVFLAIRKTQDEDVDIGEILYILDQFVRRLMIFEPHQNSIVEVILVSALVGFKAASDLAVWNVDFLTLFNESIIKTSEDQMISFNRLMYLEFQHLKALDYVIEFTEKSKIHERLAKIIDYLDLASIHTLEEGLSDLKINVLIQRAIFIKASKTQLGFFKKGSTESSSEDYILAKNPSIFANQRTLSQSF